MAQAAGGLGVEECHSAARRRGVRRGGGVILRHHGAPHQPLLLSQGGRAPE